MFQILLIKLQELSMTFEPRNIQINSKI